VIEPTAGPDPDRRAAEYVLSVGGGIEVNVAGEAREIRAVAELPKEAFRLTEVRLTENDKVTDVGLAVFKNCENLARLSLQNTAVTNAGLAHFAGCENMTLLNLVGTKVTDAGLAHLKNHQGLTHLLLANTEVSDTGLAHFKDHKKLELVDVRKTKVSAAGIDELKKASPQCKFEWDGKVNDPK